jgi:hypothetical protein
MSCPKYTAFGANAESTRLNTLENCIQSTFLLENPQLPVVCPLKLDPQVVTTVTTRLESTRLLSKVVKCPLYIRESTAGSCGAYQTLSPRVMPRVTPRAIISQNPGYIIKTQQYSNITGIQQVTQPVVGVSSGTLIARRIAAVTPSTSRFTPVFFRTVGPNTTSSGGPLYVCPPVKTSQDPGVPVANNVICRPGSRVVA